MANTDTTDTSGAPATLPADGSQVDASQSGDPGVIDWRAKYIESEQRMAKLTGKAGTVQSDLQTRLATATQEAEQAKRELGELRRSSRVDRTVEAVAQTYPEAQRSLIRTVVRGLGVDLDSEQPDETAGGVRKMLDERYPELSRAVSGSHPSTPPPLPRMSSTNATPQRRRLI